MSENGKRAISQELYEAAVSEWAAARAAYDEANAAAVKAAERCDAAEEALAAQEAFPGIAAYQHATVPAELCRIGYQCKVHASDDPIF
jgi:hypothetical protein